MPSRRAEFLEAIADLILELGDVLVECANQKTVLAVVRIVGERRRTVAKLRAFAQLVREGSLSARNPLVAKAHRGQMGTSEPTARAIIRAAQQTGMPNGVFSMLYGEGRTLGQSLVKHPALKAVGFTGSRSSGKTLFQ